MGGDLAEEKSVNYRAAIDIGTNTVLLLVADKTRDHITPIYEAQLLPRLGKGVDTNRNISTKAAGRVGGAVQSHLEDIQQRFGEIPVRITATSAVRDARNRDEVLRQLYDSTGYPVQLLSGAEEAELTFRGALSMVNQHSENPVVVDIGGGSTEVISGQGSRIRAAHSWDIGCVRFTERYLPEMPASKTQIEACRQGVLDGLGQGGPDFSGFSTELIGVAGTVTSLAALHQKLPGYDASRINGYRLTLEEIEKFMKWATSLTRQELEQLNPEVMNGRSDIMSAGLVILTEMMNFWGFQTLQVSTGGLRHGVILEGD